MTDLAVNSERRAYAICHQCEMEFVPDGNAERAYADPPFNYDPGDGFCLGCWLIAETATSVTGRAVTRNPFLQETRRMNAKAVAPARDGDGI